jgi:hypothetical protein
VRAKVEQCLQLRNKIVETQRLLQNDLRAKRCKEFSPSVTKPSAKRCASGAGPRRRSLDFDLIEPVEVPVAEVSHTISKLFQKATHISYIYKVLSDVLRS